MNYNILYNNWIELNENIGDIDKIHLCIDSENFIENKISGSETSTAIKPTKKGEKSI